MSSLRSRLFWAIAAALLTTVSLTLLAGAYLVHGSLNRAALAGLGRQADLLARRGVRPAAGPLGLFLATQDERLAVLPQRQAELLLPDAGRAGEGTVTVGGRRYLYAARPSGGDTVVLLRTKSSVAADRRPFLLALAAAAGLGALLAAIVAGVLARGVAGPVRRVAAASRRLAAGESPEPLPIRGSDELRTLASSFNDMACQLDRARDAERAFLLSVSHELKTPLTAIRGYAEALEEGVLSAVRAGGVIQIEAVRLERLVADLLELARLNRQHFAVEREPVDLAAVALDAVERHLGRARELGVELGCRTLPHAFAEADADRVLQAVSNLVENALRCTPPGGRISVEAGPGEIAVADTGPGIAAEDLPRAFERFFLYRRHGTDRPVGTGLGLAIVHELVQAMRGEVEVESRLGAGTTFRIRLPRSEPLLQPLPDETNAEPAEHEHDDDPARRVQPVALDRVCGGVPRVVRDESDARRPDDPADGVPEEEPPPRHVAEPRDPRGGVAQHCDEASEEDRLGAVPLHQALRAR